MENSIATIKANYQEILKRKVQEREAEMAMEIILRFEKSKVEYEKLQELVQRLQNGDSPEAVNRDYYGALNREYSPIETGPVNFYGGLTGKY